MKKSLTRKLTIAVIALVFAVVSLSTSTYAWFTMSNTAQVDAFNAEVKAGEGIEIAITTGGTDTELAAAQWYTGNVPAAVVETAFKKDIENGKKGFLKFDALTSTNGTSLANLEGASNDGTGYVSFWVHVKTAEKGKITLNDIVLSSSQYNSAAQTENKWESVSPWTADAEYNFDGTNTIKVGDKVTYLVENAARVYVNEVIYEKVEEDAVYDVAGSKANNATGTTNTFGSFAYYNSKNSLDSNKLDITKATNQANNVAKIGAFTAVDLGTVEANNVLKFEVKIWIEGWDAECLNAIFGQRLTTQLNIGFNKVQ